MNLAVFGSTEEEARRLFCEAAAKEEELRNRPESEWGKPPDRRGTYADQLPANVLPMRARTFRQSLLGLLGRIARSASRRLGTRHTGRFCGQTVLCDAYASPPLQPRPIWMDLLRLQHFLAMHSGRAGQAAIRSAPLPPKAHACVEVWCPGCDATAHAAVRSTRGES